jgi:hypothetical protein
MKKVVFCVLLLFAAMSLAAADVHGLRYQKPEYLPDLQVPFSDLMHGGASGPEQRIPEAIHPQVVLEGSEDGFVLPIVGSTPGGGGTFFRSETVIVNRKSTSQLVGIYYFPIGGGAANCTRPAKSLRMDGRTWYFWSDFVSDYLGTSGLGAVIVIGLTSGGQIDTSAAIDGNSRIWTPEPGTNGTASQNFPSVSLQMPAGAQSSFGLRSDEFYRSNYGIFNYDTVARTFDITANGLRGQSTFSTTVDACSAILTGLPGGPYGSYELVIAARDGRASYFSFGSSVDNSTGDSWSVIGRSF